MTLGNYNRHQAQKKKQVQLAAAFPQGIRCQKCLAYGHWSYECQNKRKILIRPSRTQVMKRNLKTLEEGGCSNGTCPIPKKKKSACRDCSDSSSNEPNTSNCSSSSDDSSSSSSSDSDSDSSSSDSSSSCSDSEN